MENKSIGKLIKWCLPWLISISLLLVLIYKIKLPDFEFFPNSLKSGLFIFVLFLSVYNNTIISGLKFKYVIKILGCRIPLKEAVLIKTGSIPIKAVFPFKSGEAVRAVYLKRNHNFSYQKGFFSIALGYLLSISALFLTGLTGWLLYQRNFLYGISSVLFAAFIVVFLKKVDSEAFTLKILEKINKKWFHQTQQFFDDTRNRGVGKDILTLFFVSLAFEMIKIIDFFLVFMMFKVSVPLLNLVFLAPLVVLIVSLPFTISGIGTREAAIVFLFTGFGTSETLLSAGLTLSFLESVIPILVGALLMKTFLGKLISRDDAVPPFGKEENAEIPPF